MTIENKRQPRDLRAELESYDSTLPESWKPDPGDILEGILARYEEVDAGHGPKKIAIIEDQGTSKIWAVWLSPKVLCSEFEKHRPRPGEHIAIKRYSDHEKGYKVYKLVVDREIEDDPAGSDGFGTFGNSRTDGNGGQPGTEIPF
jgi:hypothetical protein